MSSSQLNQCTAKYVLQQFDAGIQPREILNSLQLAGHRGIQLTTIEECLQKHGRNSKPPNNASTKSQTTTKPSGSKTAKSQTPATKPVANPELRRDWDAKANTFVWNAHSYGQTAFQIVNTLVKKGYTVTETDVADILHRQKEAQKNVPTFCWNAQADKFAAAAASMGHPVAQITAKLWENGYRATTADVAASLQRQGLVYIE